METQLWNGSLKIGREEHWLEVCKVFEWGGSCCMGVYGNE